MESDIAFSMCQFGSNGIVGPSNLQKGLFTVGALDNIDHNRTSATSQSSFHGSGISIIQFPTSHSVGEFRIPVPFTRGNPETSSSLPQSYSTIPAMNQ